MQTKESILSAIEQVKQILKSRKCQSYRDPLSHRYSFFLGNKQNETLQSALLETGIFDFYTTNRGFIIGYSQVVFYIHNGYKAYLNGQTTKHGENDVHHLDANVGNNNPDNLVLIPVWLHKICSKAQTRIGCAQLFKSKELPIDNVHQIPIYNNDGKLITNVISYAAHIVKLTVQKTFNSLKINLKSKSTNSRHLFEKSFKRVVFFCNNMKEILTQVQDYFLSTKHWKLPVNSYELHHQYLLNEFA